MILDLDSSLEKAEGQYWVIPSIDRVFSSMVIADRVFSGLVS